MRAFFVLLIALCLTFSPAYGEGITQHALDADTRNRISLEIDMNPQTHSLSVTQHMRVYNPTGQSQKHAYFYLYPNAYRRESTLPIPGEHVETVYKSGWAPGGIEIVSVLFGGKSANWGVNTASESILRVSCDWAKDAFVEITLTYRVVLPPGTAVLGANENIWRLCHFQPLPVVYEDGNWRFDQPSKMGDSLGLLPISDFYATITLPKEWVPIAGATVVQVKQENGRSTYTIDAPRMRECSIALTKGYSVIESAVDGTIVRSVFRNRGGGAAALDSAVRALKLYNAWFGAYPYPVLSVVESPFFAGGMEMPGLVYISDALYTGANARRLDFTVAHEVAHQWWYALVASDGYLAPWLDEALTQYTTYLYVEETRGREAFLQMLRDEVAPALSYTQPGGLSVDSEAALFYTMNEYVAVVYLRGAAVFHELRLALGRTGFIEGLKLYAERKAFDIATYADLFDAFRDATGRDITAFMLDYLRNPADIAPDYTYE